MQIICQHCQAKGNIDDKWLGKKIKCPKCKNSFIAQEALSVEQDPQVEEPKQPETVQPPPPPTESTPTKKCSQCRKPTPVSELVDFDGTPVCANCKTVYLQKIKEGVASSDVVMVYAGFWIRACAKIIDSLITGLAGGIVGFAMGFLLIQLESDPFIGAIINQIIGFGIGITYATWFVGKFGATPGKMALGLKIVKPDASPLTYMQAFGRFWAEMLSGLILCIGYLMVAFDDEKRALHDRICATRVIRVR